MARMSKKSLGGKICARLDELGFQHVKDTAKFRVYKNGAEFLFVGRAGAVRTGKNVTTSRPVAERTRIELGLPLRD